MRIGNMGFWPSAVAGGFFILRGKRAGAGKNPAPTEMSQVVLEPTPPSAPLAQGGLFGGEFESLKI